MLTTTYAELIPTNDQRRLEALRAYQLLGAQVEAGFDEIVRLAAKLFDVPIALISLVDAENVEFAGNFGLPGIDKVAREDSICSVAVLHDHTTVFEDLRLNPCHLTNQAAAQQLDLGFYAGHPLRTAAGFNVGSLCVIDHQPRQVSGPERERLAALADLVVQLFDLRLALQDQPAAAAVAWQHIYQSIGESLTRIDTLRGLRQWEDSAATEAAQRYQQSIDDEFWLITYTLSSQVKAAMPQA